MATILGLAMKISADATGVQKSLTPVERALAKLDDQAKTITSSFDRFAGSSSAAAAAQAKAAADLERLTQQLQAGAITAPEYARAFEELGNAVDAEVAAFERAARTIEANLSPLQWYDAEVKVLAQDLEAGRIDQETFDRAIAKATATFTKAEAAAQGYSNAVEGAGKGNLQFNELSGILSSLPGPLGNVAGRLSGLSSAGEGLSRVFSGGLSSGLSSVGASVAGLVNPFTAAVVVVCCGRSRGCRNRCREWARPAFRKGRGTRLRGPAGRRGFRDDSGSGRGCDQGECASRSPRHGHSKVRSPPRRRDEGKR